MSAPFAPSSFYDVGLAFKNLADHLDLFGDRFDRLEQRLATLESKPSPPAASSSVYLLPHSTQSRPRENDRYPVYYG